MATFDTLIPFDKLIQEIGSRYHLGPKSRSLVQEILDLIAAQPGGIGAFLNRFKAAGFAAEVASWLGGTEVVPLSGQEVGETLGSGVINEIANNIDLSQSFVRTILGYAIPKIIGQLAQDGAIPPAIQAAASSLPDLAMPLSSSRAGEITQLGAEQIPLRRMEHGGAAPPPGRLLIPGACLLITLGFLGYAISYSANAGGAIPFADRDKIVSSLKSVLGPQFAVAPVAGSGAAETAAASSALKSGFSGTIPAGAQNQPALDLPAINFAANSAEVSSSGKALLQRAAGLMQQLPARTVVQISGYTHNAGHPTANTKLSLRRANAVRQVLIGAGVNPATLTAKGYGSPNFLANNNGTMEGRSNGTVEGRPRNDRRVEFSIVQP